MADELYRAQLDGYDLDIETLDDAFEKSIVRHEIPNKDGALLEDMGQKARTVNIRVYFWDHGDHQTYADHIDFLNHLKSTALSALIHPQYGSMQGMIERVSVRHDDRNMTAELDITFVENLRDSIDDIAYEDVEAAVEEAVVASQEEQMAAFIVDIQDELGAESVGILEEELDAGQGIYTQFQGYSQRAKKYLKKLDTFVATMEGTLTDIANPANGIIATINYGTNLPGRVIGSLSRCIERYVVLYDSIKNAPSRFLSNLDQAMLGLEATVGFGKHLRIGFAIQAAQVVAGVYKSDEQSRQTVRKSESTMSFDVRGNYLATATTEPILTINELEESLVVLRTMLQTAIDQDRSIDSLKTMARSLMEHVNTIKLERDKIITVPLDNEMPLHIVCHRYGLDYNYAERIASINRIKNPNFTAGEVRIYGR
jgi:prophage DNA circulation protein